MSEAASALSEREQALVAAALRVYRRYQVEIVEGLGLCPWAERARLDGHVRERVVLLREPDPLAAVDALTALIEDPQVEIGLLLFPRLRLGRLDFERFVARVRAEHTRRDEAPEDAGGVRGGARMALAAFHPDAPPELAEAARLVPFLRRSPDPTIQLVRRSVLESVRATDQAHGTGLVDLATLDVAAFLAAPAQRPIHENVAAHNLATVTRLGPDAVEAILRDIRTERDALYEALGESAAARAQ